MCVIVISKLPLLVYVIGLKKISLTRASWTKQIPLPNGVQRCKARMKEMAGFAVQAIAFCLSRKTAKRSW